MSAECTQGTPENALRELGLNTLTLADHDRIALVQRALAQYRKTCGRWAAEVRRYEKAVAKARKLMRGTVHLAHIEDDPVYRALSWRERR